VVLAFILFIAIKTSLTCSYGSKFHQVINISLSLRPHFLILASDGLWDTFSNEEACTFVQEHLKESDFGAKSLVMESYKRGSVDKRDTANRKGDGRQPQTKNGNNGGGG